jgi:8-oxo-dGTP diphosphatase
MPRTRLLIPLLLTATLCFFLLVAQPMTAMALISTTRRTMASASSSSSSSSLPQHIDKLALILVQARRQLVARSKGKTVFFTPGGKREAGESDHEALCRECKEELCVDLKKASINPYGVVFEAQAFGKPVGTMVRMRCYTADYVGTLQPSEEVEELAWIRSDFPREKLTLTGIMILDDLKEKGLID